MAKGISVKLDTRAAVLSLARAVPSVEREVVKETSATSIAVQSVAKQIVPILDGPLRASINIERFEGGLIQTVGSNKVYAAAIEFGTEDSLSQPYLQPALESNIQDHARRLKRAVQRGLVT